MSLINSRSTKTGPRRRRLGQSGVGLLEVMIASFLLLVVFMGLATVYSRGRAQMNLETDRRQATSILQSRMDSIRRELTYDTLADLDETLTSYSINGKTFQVGHSVSSEDPDTDLSTVTLTVTWNARVGANTVTRAQSCTTILARASS